MFQEKEGEMLRFQELDEVFQEVLKELHAVGEILIPERVDIGEDISLWRSLSRGSTTEVLNRVLDTLVIKANNICIIMEVGRGGRG